MKILVCSLSKLKYNAVSDAVARLGFSSPDIQTCATSSGVPNQPLGDDQTLLGALHRAGHGEAGHYVVALENGVAARRNDYVIALENGIATRRSGFVDLAYVVVVAPSGHTIVRSSRSVPVPFELVEKTRSSGQQTTCGQLEAARTPGCDHDDPHVVWSGGTTNRRSLLAEAVEEALRAAIQAEYTEHQRNSMIPKTVHIEVGGVSRELVVREVAPGVHLGILLLACDPELTEAAGQALAAKMPADVDVLVMPDGKAQGLLHVVQRESRKPAVLIRKERKSYLVEPVLEVTAKSVTTMRQHAFYLGADDAHALRGKTVAILDDVVSTGGTVRAIEQMLAEAGVVKTYVLAVGTEGQPRADVIALTHFEVFTC